MDFFFSSSTSGPFRCRAIPEGQVFLTPAPWPLLNLRDPTDGRLERFALTVTGPDHAVDGDSLAIVHAAHERVQLGEGALFRLPAKGRPPPEAPAHLFGLAAYAPP